MYNFIWNIHKRINAKDSSITYIAEFNNDGSHGMFNDFRQSYTFEEIDIKAMELQLIEAAANYLSSIDPYNRIIDSTDIQFNYIRYE